MPLQQFHRERFTLVIVALHHRKTTDRRLPQVETKYVTSLLSSVIKLARRQFSKLTQCNTSRREQPCESKQEVGAVINISANLAPQSYLAQTIKLPLYGQ